MGGETLITVLVADDEKWMRDEISSSIDWETHGFMLLGEAGDGLEALEMIRQLKPDIVLADIQMPGLDGIELFRRVKDTGLSCVFIYFSGYDRFEYAKNAVNLGALGYILKPVDEKELLELLIKAKNCVLAERQERLYNEKLVDLSSRVLQQRHKDFFYNVMHKRIHLPDEVNEAVIKLELPLRGSLFTLFNCRIDNLRALALGGLPNPAEKFKNVLGGLIADFLKKYGFHFYSVDYEVGSVAIVNYSTVDCLVRDEIFRACEQISASFQAVTGATITIGIGNEVSEIGNIHQSFSESQKAIEQRLIAGRGTIIDISNVKKSLYRTVLLDPALQKNITEGIEKCDSQLADSVAYALQKTLKKGDVSIEDIRNFNYQFIEHVFRILSKVGGSPAGTFGNPHVLCDELDMCEDMDELVSKVKNILDAAIQAAIGFKSDYYIKLRGSVKKYIEEHYSGDISLESVAKEFKFHPNYLCKLFKDEIGVNFIDYITELRIEKSKELLADIRYTVYDVARKVGYNDAKYFTKVFKKVAGITPSEYMGKVRK
jgi:two-component system response regulator YesN